MAKYLLNLCTYHTCECTAIVNKPARILAQMGEVLLRPYLLTRSYWQFKTVGIVKESFSFEDVTTSRLPILEWMAPYKCAYGQHSMDSVGYQKRNGDELGRNPLGIQKSCRRKEGSRYDSIPLYICIYKVLKNKEKHFKSFKKLINWVVMSALNLNTQETEVDKYLSSRPV